MSERVRGNICYMEHRNIGHYKTCNNHPREGRLNSWTKDTDEHDGQNMHKSQPWRSSLFVSASDRINKEDWTLGIRDVSGDQKNNKEMMSSCAVLKSSKLSSIKARERRAKHDVPREAIGGPRHGGGSRCRGWAGAYGAAST